MSQWINRPVKIDAIEFDGDTINCTASRLKVSDMAALVGRKIDLTTREGQLEVCTIGGEILPRYLRSMDGLTDADGNAVAMQTFLDNIDEFFFAPLTAVILLRLIEASSVKASEKN